MARYFAHYMDDGPAGPCGQSHETTKSWNQLYAFDRPKPWLDFIHDVQHADVDEVRLNARITGAWAEGDEHYEQITVLPSPRASTSRRRA